MLLGDTISSLSRVNLCCSNAEKSVSDLPMATLQGNKPLGKEREGVIKQWTMDTYHHPGAFFFLGYFCLG